MRHQHPVQTEQLLQLYEHSSAVLCAHVLRVVFILETELFLSLGYYLQTLPLPPTVGRRGLILASLQVLGL